MIPDSIIRGTSGWQPRAAGEGVDPRSSRRIERRVGRPTGPVEVSNISHGLADDPHAVELAIGELELHVDASGAVQVMSLGAGELRRRTGVRQQTLSARYAPNKP